MKYLLIFFSLFISVAYISAAELPSVDDIQALESMKLGKNVVEEIQYKEIQTSTLKDEVACADCIFGYDFFQSTPTTFALSSNVPIPTDYTLGPGDKILVEVKKSINSALVIIEDNGPGIPKNEYSNVFRPFYRIDKSRGLNKSGVGLGLSVAQDIIKSHGGNISLSESRYKGLLVKISLPL